MFHVTGQHSGGGSILTVCIEIGLLFLPFTAHNLTSVLNKTREMLLLFETAAGYALFKVLKESKLKKLKNVEVCVHCELLSHGRHSAQNHESN